MMDVMVPDLQTLNSEPPTSSVAVKAVLGSPSGGKSLSR
jgi:hypothetical protein